MEAPTSYCEMVAGTSPDNVHRIYHDTQYGFPIHSDDELFGRLILEINQAGLSWTTILNKQDNFRDAYADFSISEIAAFDEEDINRLLNNPGIIRNKLKINAAIHNAKVVLGLQEDYGSFEHWLNHQYPNTKEEWVTLFKKTFKFTGGEITNEFLLSTGYLPGAHQKGCPVYDEVLKHKPRWYTHK